MSAENETEITLSGNHKATIRKLTALQAIQVTSYMGNDPSPPVVNMATAVGSVINLDGEDVTPCANKNMFVAVAQRLQAEDTVLIGVVLASMMMSGVTEQQKNELESLASGLSADSSGSA